MGRAYCALERSSSDTNIFFWNCYIPSEDETGSDSSLAPGSSCCRQWRRGTGEICEKSQCLQCCHIPQLCLWSFERLQRHLLHLVRMQFPRRNSLRNLCFLLRSLLCLLYLLRRQ